MREGRCSQGRMPGACGRCAALQARLRRGGSDAKTFTQALLTTAKRTNADSQAREYGRANSRAAVVVSLLQNHRRRKDVPTTITISGRHFAAQIWVRGQFSGVSWALLDKRESACTWSNDHHIMYSVVLHMLLQTSRTAMLSPFQRSPGASRCHQCPRRRRSRCHHLLRNRNQFRLPHLRRRCRSR